MSGPDDIQALWAEQTTVPLEVDMRRIEAEAGTFERSLRRRNTVELAAAAIVAVVFSAYAASYEAPLARLGAIGVVVGVGVVVAVLLRFGREAALPPADHATAAFLEGYRAALLRQARLLAWAPAWYVLPLLAPAAVFVVGAHAESGAQGSLAAELGTVAVVGVAVAALNLVASRRMRQKAETLA